MNFLGPISRTVDSRQLNEVILRTEKVTTVQILEVELKLTKVGRQKVILEDTEDIEIKPYYAKWFVGGNITIDSRVKSDTKKDKSQLVKEARKLSQDNLVEIKSFPTGCKMMECLNQKFGKNKLGFVKIFPFSMNLMLLKNQTCAHNKSMKKIAGNYRNWQVFPDEGSTTSTELQDIIR